MSNYVLIKNKWWLTYNVKNVKMSPDHCFFNWFSNASRSAVQGANV